MSFLRKKGTPGTEKSVQSNADGRNSDFGCVCLLRHWTAERMADDTFVSVTGTFTSLQHGFDFAPRRCVLVVYTGLKEKCLFTLVLFCRHRE